MATPTSNDDAGSDEPTAAAQSRPLPAIVPAFFPAPLPWYHPPTSVVSLPPSPTFASSLPLRSLGTHVQAYSGAQLQIDPTLVRRASISTDAGRSSSTLSPRERTMSQPQIPSTRASHIHFTSFPYISPHSRPPSGVTPDNVAHVERAFVSGLFHGITLPPQAPPRARTWHAHVSMEEHLLVMFRAMDHAGFDTLGDFLAAVFTDEYHVHQPVIQKISYFLCCRNQSGARPQNIVDLMFRHRKSQAFIDRIPVPPSFPSFPSYACVLPVQSPPLQPPARECCRNALLDWALVQIIHRVDREADCLLEDPRLISLDEIKWDKILSFSLKEMQHEFVQTAPALFAVAVTVAVNKTTRKQLARAQASQSSCQPAAEPGSAQPAPTEVADNDVSFETDPDPDPDGIESELNVRRDPWLATTVAILMLLAIRYRFATIFPTIVGLFLFMNHTHHTIYRILNRVGISVAYSTILRKLHALASDSSERLHAWGHSARDGSPMFLILFDNINQMRRSWRKTLGDLDHVQSGTAATLVRLEDVPLGAMDPDKLEAHRSAHSRADLTVEELLQDIDWKHIEGVGVATVLRIYVKYIPALACHRPAVESLFSMTHQKHALRLRKSDIETLRCSNIDESTTVGTGTVLSDIVFSQLSLLPQWLQRALIFVCGDQLTIDRLRKLKRYLHKTKDRCTRHDWVLPVIQLWHMKWAWQKAIVRLHWSAESGRGIFGLRHDVHLLQREKFNHIKCGFYQAHHLVQDRMEALVLHALRLTCEETTGISHDSRTPLIDSLSKYFNADGPLASPEFCVLQEHAQKCFARHLRNSAHDAARGFLPRDPQTYGTSDSHHAPDERGTDSLGDDVLANAVNFMRVAFWYLEFCAAVAEGDIGRVMEIIKLLRFSFWGAGSTNYGNELLEMACALLREYPPELCSAMLNNYLVNPSGLSGHWHELDLLQEHFNFWLKRLFNSKSLDFDSAFLKEAVSLNLRGFSVLRDRLAELFGVGKQSGRHTHANVIADINTLGHHYYADHILTFCKGRVQPLQIVNEFAQGLEKLDGGQLGIFLQRTKHDHPDMQQDDVVPDDAGEKEQIPNPIVMHNGVASLEVFVLPSGDGGCP